MCTGDILKELRKDNKLTQSEVGAILNVAPSTVGSYEKEINSIPISSLKKLAQYYNVSSDYILGIASESVSWKDLEEHIFENDNNVTLYSFINDIKSLNKQDKQTLLQVLKSLKIKSKYSKQ